MTNINPKWFFGYVEDVEDPDKKCRVRVRIMGVHEDSKEILATEYLPWYEIMMPAVGPSTSGYGRSATGLQVGELVMGMAFDDAYQDCKVLWSYHGTGDIFSAILSQIPEIVQNVLDNQTKVADGGNNWEEPQASYENITYPDNVTCYYNGQMLVEFDSTDKARRINMLHPVGSYWQMLESGEYIQKSASHFYQLSKGDFRQWVGGRQRVTVNMNSVCRFNKDAYNKVTGNLYFVGENGMLVKVASKVEYDTPSTKFSGDVAIGGVLRVPEIRVTKLYADNIESSGGLNGTAAYSKMAGIAGSLSGVSPVSGESAGSIDATITMSDTGGDLGDESTSNGDNNE